MCRSRCVGSQVGWWKLERIVQVCERIRFNTFSEQLDDRGYTRIFMSFNQSAQKGLGSSGGGDLYETQEDCSNYSSEVWNEQYSQRWCWLRYAVMTEDDEPTCSQDDGHHQCSSQETGEYDDDDYQSLLQPCPPFPTRLPAAAPATSATVSTTISGSRVRGVRRF